MVNFEDGELVKGAYVVIDGKEYEVHMPQYSGRTPLSSENLNKVQNDLNETITKQGKILNDKITNTNTYSTEEVNTGKKWIDGKDIYRKVITQNNANQINLTNLSIDTLIEKRGQVKVTNPPYDICALDFSWTGGDSVLRGIFTQYVGNALIFNPKNITVGYIQVILEYTKAS
nr:MAG TPA: hypothetical protein [Caudoviricetes sp.]